LYRR